MNTNQSIKMKIASLVILPVSMLLFSGCGQKIAGGYVLSESGGMQTTYGASSSCGSVSLTFTDNSNSVTATGSNACYSQQLTGIDEGNGTIQVTSLILTPITSTGGYGGGTTCTYSGTLTVVNNVVTGTLTPTISGYCGNYPLTISGTKVN